eukprot:TRINITY_DN11691_c0_g2_i1.p1 TRINITY_DN11691_c0_g2~~TRINITY_DN11691_c0_g2_i1.p1  ORF type:complete len:551 (-),score=89.86 TRINITY_DN11691_c0_g2_i1:51-1703(-)
MSSNASPYLQQLLAQQLEAIERVLAFNQCITLELGKPGEGSLGRDGKLHHPAVKNDIQASTSQQSAVLSREGDIRLSSESPGSMDTARSWLAGWFGQSERQVPVTPLENMPYPNDESDDFREPLLKREPPETSTLALPTRRKGAKLALAPPRSPFKAEASNLRARMSSHHKDRVDMNSCWQRIARSAGFQNLTLVVIFLNTLWIAVDTDLNKATVLCNAPMIFQIVDNIFCTYFTFEITVRFMACADKLDAFNDFSFMFDAFLVSLMIWETWIQVAIFLMSSGNAHFYSGMRSASVFRLFRIFRLLRVSRLTRLLRAVPELLILVKSLGSGLRCMMVALSMLMILIYMFAIVFAESLAGTDEGGGLFESVPQGMNLMLVQVLCGFDADVFATMLNAGPVYYMLWLSYVFMASLSLMNILIGILCEVVSETAECEKEDELKREMAHEIGLLGTYDLDEFTISQPQMVETIDSPRVTSKLRELHIDVGALLDIVHLMDSFEVMDIAEFVDMLTQFRGTRTATVKDVVELRKYLSTELMIIETRLSQGFHLRR